MPRDRVVRRHPSCPGGDFFGLALDGTGDTLPMTGAREQSSQNKQIQGALHQGKTVVVGLSGRMSTRESQWDADTHGSHK